MMSKKYVLSAIVGLFAAVSFAPITEAVTAACGHENSDCDCEQPLQVQPVPQQTDGFLSRQIRRRPRAVTALFAAAVIGVIGALGGEAPIGGKAATGADVMGEIMGKYSEATDAKEEEFEKTREYQDAKPLVKADKLYKTSFKTEDDQEVWILASASDKESIHPVAGGFTITRSANFDDVKLFTKEPLLTHFDEDNDKALDYRSLGAFTLGEGSRVEIEFDVAKKGDCGGLVSLVAAGPETECNPMSRDVKDEDECLGQGVVFTPGKKVMIGEHGEEDAKKPADAKSHAEEFQVSGEPLDAPSKVTWIITNGHELTVNADGKTSTAKLAQIGTDMIFTAGLINDAAGIFSKTGEKSTEEGCGEDAEMTILFKSVKTTGEAEGQLEAVPEAEEAN